MKELFRQAFPEFAGLTDDVINDYIEEMKKEKANVENFLMQKIEDDKK